MNDSTYLEQLEDYTHEELEESQRDIDDILEAQNGQY